MPRRPRVLEQNVVYHVFNRRTDRQLLFPSPRAFDEFLELIQKGRDRYNVRICAYCVMDTHWHQAIWIPQNEGVPEVVKYLRRLSTSHAVRFRRSSATRGNGHVYQDRYKSKPVFTAAHYWTLLRYIEGNPVTGGRVERAEHWPWSSLTDRLHGRRRILDPGPVPLPTDWAEMVNAAARRGDYEVV